MGTGEALLGPDPAGSGACLPEGITDESLHERLLDDRVAHAIGGLAACSSSSPTLPALPARARVGAAADGGDELKTVFVHMARTNGQIQRCTEL